MMPLFKPSVRYKFPPVGTVVPCIREQTAFGTRARARAPALRPREMTALFLRHAVVLAVAVAAILLWFALA
jgi:hypothetical protein